MKKLFFDHELDEEVKKGLGALADEPRQPERAEAGRAAFLAGVEEARQSVSPGANRRHIGWMASILAVFHNRKEKSPMLTTIVTFITVLTLILGGGGITVAAAQSAMPDQALYSVKTWTENVQYEWTAKEQTRLALAMDFSERRMAEIKTMLQAGNLPEQAVLVRYQAQVETALRLAAGMTNNEERLQALQQVELRLQAQQQLMNQLHPGIPALQMAMVQIQQMLQVHLQWARQGAQDPAMLQQQIQDQQGAMQQAGGGSPWVEVNPHSAGGRNSTPGNCLICTPAQDGSNSQNPWTFETPVPGSGYGPGPGTGDGTTSTPAMDGSGSQNPWTSETPIPGSGYGPGPGMQTPQPSQTSMMQPGGNGAGSGSATMGPGSGSGGMGRP